MLGDINIAEPGSLIGFAGPRVIKETIKKDLPKGFQTAEFVQEHGFLDFIVDRREMKEKLSTFLKMMRAKIFFFGNKKTGRFKASPFFLQLWLFYSIPF